MQRAINIALSRQVNAPVAVGTQGVFGCAVYLPEGSYSTSAPLYLDGNNPAGGPWNAAQPGVTPARASPPSTCVIGDVITLTASSALISGGSVSVTLTMSTTNIYDQIGRLVAIVNGNPLLSSLVFAQLNPAPGINLYGATAASIAWTGTYTQSSLLPPVTAPLSFSAGTPVANNIARPFIRIVGDGPRQTVITASIGTTGLAIYGALGLSNDGRTLGGTFFDISELSIIGTVDPNTFGNAGIQLASASNNFGYLSAISITNVIVTSFSRGIDLTCATSIVIDGASILQCFYGIYLSTAGSAIISNTIVAGTAPTAFPGSGAAISVVGQNGAIPLEHLSEGVAIKNVVTSGNFIGLSISDQHFGTCVSTEFSGYAGSCLLANRGSLNGTVAGWSFSGCSFRSNSTSVPVVVMDKYTSHVQFTGCSMSGGTVGAMLGTGYTVFTGQRYVISGCQFFNNTVSDIVLTLITNNILLSRGSGAAIVESTSAYSSTNVALNNVVGNIVPSGSGGISLVPAAGSAQTNNLAV